MIVIVLIASMALSIVGLALISVDTNFGIFMPFDSVQAREIAAMEERFGDSNQLIVLMGTYGDFIDIDDVDIIIDELTTLPGITRSSSALDLMDSPAAAGGVEQLDRLAEQVTGLPLLISNQEEAAEMPYWVMVQLFLESDVYLGNLIPEVEAKIAESGRQYLMSGEPYLQGKLFTSIVETLIVLPPIAVLLLLLVFRLRIGSTPATLLTMVPAIVGALLTLGVMSWIQGTLSMMTVMVPIFVIVLGSADGLHITSHVIDGIRKGKDRKTSVYNTFEAVGPSIIMTTITTMIGFLAMLTIGNPGIFEMALGSALGIVIAGLITWLLLPIMLIAIPLNVKPKPKKEGKLVVGLRRVQGRPIAIFSILLIAVSIPGALRIGTDFSMASLYKEGTDVRQSIERVSKALGASLPVMVSYPSTSPLDPQVSEAIIELQNRARSNGLAINSLSIPGLTKSLQRAQTGQEELPQDPELRRELESIVVDQNPDVISSFYYPSRSSGETGWSRASFSLTDLSDETLSAFLDLTQRVSDQYGVKLQPVSLAFGMKEQNDTMVVQQIQSLLIALAAVILITSISLRSLKYGLLSALPIALTLVGLFGFMGFAGLELSIVSGIYMGMTVGVGIDYSLHYMGMYRHLRRRNKTGEENLGDETLAQKALGLVATPVLANAMGLAIGFTVMILSPFRNHTVVSLLMWVTMVLSSLLSLGIIPSVLDRKNKGNKAV